MINRVEQKIKNSLKGFRVMIFYSANALIVISEAGKSEERNLKYFH